MAMATTIVNTHEAKSQLSELIRQVLEGAEVIVAHNGQPVAKIIQWPPPIPKGQPGAWAGEVRYRDDIVGPDTDIMAMFSESTGGMA